jgi:hypothetical protein
VHTVTVLMLEAGRENLARSEKQERHEPAWHFNIRYRQSTSWLVETREAQYRRVPLARRSRRTSTPRDAHEARNRMETQQKGEENVHGSLSVYTGS